VFIFDVHKKKILGQKIFLSQTVTRKKKLAHDNSFPSYGITLPVFVDSSTRAKIRLPLEKIQPENLLVPDTICWTRKS
jgi:hypothetical protein